jgi:hypothetical protein
MQVGRYADNAQSGAGIALAGLPVFSITLDRAVPQRANPFVHLQASKFVHPAPTAREVSLSAHIGFQWVLTLCSGDVWNDIDE